MRTFSSFLPAGRIGIKELTAKVTELVSKLPPTLLHDDAENGEVVYNFEEVKKYDIVIHDGIYEVTGAWIKTIFNSTNFEDTESLNFFERTLESSGIIADLKRPGSRKAIRSKYTNSNLITTD